MKVLGNIIWHFPFFGFVSASITYLLGLLLTMTVVAAPVGLGLMELGKLLFWPFGNAMVKQSDVSAVPNSAWQTYSKIVMLVYLPLGLILVVLGAIQVVLLFMSIVGIPAAMVVAKSLGTFLNPVGKKKVTSAMADELERRKAQRALDGLPPEDVDASATTSPSSAPLPGLDIGDIQGKLQSFPKKTVVIGIGGLVAVIVLFNVFGGDSNSRRAGAEAAVKKELAREIFKEDKPSSAFGWGSSNSASEERAAEAAKEKALTDQAAAEKLASERAKAEADAKAAAEKAQAEKEAAARLLAEQEEAKKKTTAATVKSTAPATAIATQPATNPPKSPNAAIVDGMVKDGMDCFKAKRFDCAISQAKSALRLDPNSASAKSLMQRAKAGQQAAMDGIEIR